MTEEGIAQQRKTVRKVFLLIAGLFIIAIIIGGFYFSKQSSETIARMRDISIILLALVFLLIGAAMVILVAQLAVLTTLVQNKVEPILNSTKDTVSTVHSSTEFISKHAVAPIITISSTMAGVKKMFEIIGFIRKK
jgi:hypothetical protein